jgi:16S rRNA processing protein RimM
MIVLGRIVAPYGVRGWVRIHPFGDDPDSWRQISKWWLGADAESTSWREAEITGLRTQGSTWVAKFAGVDDRNGAEALDGWYIAAPRAQLPKTAVGEYYWADLLGLVVVNEQGEALGKVASLLETGVHPVLVVQDGETERLLPFVEAVVLEVDSAAARIRVAWGKDW